MAGLEELSRTPSSQNIKCCDKQCVKQIVLQTAIGVATYFFAFSGFPLISLAFCATSIVPVCMVLAKKAGVSLETIDKVNLFVGGLGIIGATAVAVTGSLTVSVPLLIAGYALGVISLISTIKTSDR